MKSRLFTCILALFLVLLNLTWSHGQTGLREKILVGGDDNYPPYEYLDNHGQPDGFNIDIIRAVAKVMGLTLDLELGPWSQVRRDLEQGRLDAISGMYYSAERDQLVDFSSPHILVSYAVFVRKGSPIKNLKDIANQRIIVQQGDMGDDYVTDRKLGSRIIRMENPAAALRMLAGGRQDCAVLPRLLGLYLINQLDLDNIKTVGSPFLSRKYCFAVREGDRELLGLLNEGLSVIKNTGQYDRIYNKWFGLYEKRSALTKLFKYAPWVLAPLLGLLAVFIGWSWSLRRTVAARTEELVSQLAERQRTEEALRESEEKYRRLVDNANDAIFIAQDETVKFTNPMCLQMTGYSPEDFAQTPFVQFIHPDDAALVMERYLRRLKGEDVPSTYYFRIIHKSGHNLWVQLNAALITWEGRPATINFLRDVSEQKRLEEQLRQSQKMEALGTLAGGIAHDFNNLLQAIGGYTELLLMDKSPDTLDYQELRAIQAAGQRASDLVRQLLTYSRKVETEKHPVDLNRQVQRVSEIFQRTFPKMIDIQLNLAACLWPVNADSNQLEQTLMNLGANARDAMPEGGRLVLSTQNVTVDSNAFDHDGQAGAANYYVLLTVSDTGHGMDQEVKDHIFDPFFTTKEPGRGTGLGLASVYGIVKNHNGHIFCDSRPGNGTSFRIYLPALVEAQISENNPAPASAPQGGVETVLVVDDERDIRTMADQMLRRHGYQVLMATTGEEALTLMAKPQHIDLVILDLSMPGMGGLKCLTEMLKIDPHLKVVIASGYSGDTTVQDALKAGAAEFMAKPYRYGDLLNTIRRLLDQSGR